MGFRKNDDEKPDLSELTVSLTDLESHFEAQLGLCNALEKLADSLPGNINKQECLYVARSIYPIIKSAHEYEENSFFPFINKSEAESELPVTIDRLHAEHWEDENYAGEIQEALIDFVTHPEHSNPEAIGYMLRGFFEGVRRHIAFERIFLPKSYYSALSH